MERFDKIATIRNEVEAIRLRGELEERGILHAMYSNYDLAYDGLFQFSAGWGRVEAPLQRRDEILEILDAIRRQSAEQNNGAAEGEDNAGE
ncbi:MAG: hypothetical protein ABSA77_07075 [Thermoguttaceae bacterium]|jgi:hypothetical protein